MASSKKYLDFILEQLSELEEISYRAMMGEYIVYYRGKIVGGIYDDRFLVKPVKAAISLMPDSSYELPYEKAKALGYEAVIVEGNPQNYNSRGFKTSYQHGIVASPKIALPAVKCLMVKELVAGALSHMKGTVDYSDYECLR